MFALQGNRPSIRRDVATMTTRRSRWTGETAVRGMTPNVGNEGRSTAGLESRPINQRLAPGAAGERTG